MQRDRWHDVISILDEFRSSRAPRPTIMGLAKLRIRFIAARCPAAWPPPPLRSPGAARQSFRHRRPGHCRARPARAFAELPQRARDPAAVGDAQLQGGECGARAGQRLAPEPVIAVLRREQGGAERRGQPFIAQRDQLAAVGTGDAGIGIDAATGFPGGGRASMSVVSRVPRADLVLEEAERRARGAGPAVALGEARGQLRARPFLRLGQPGLVLVKSAPSGSNGPIAPIDEAVPVIVLAASGLLFEKTVSTMQEVRAHGGQIALISDREGLDGAGGVASPRSSCPRPIH